MAKNLGTSEKVYRKISDSNFGISFQATDVWCLFAAHLGQWLVCMPPFLCIENNASWKNKKTNVLQEQTSFLMKYKYFTPACQFDSWTSVSLLAFCLKLSEKWSAVFVLQIVPEIHSIIMLVHYDRLAGTPSRSVTFLVGPDRQTDGNFQPWWHYFGIGKI